MCNATCWFTKPHCHFINTGFQSFIIYSDGVFNYSKRKIFNPKFPHKDPTIECSFNFVEHDEKRILMHKTVKWILSLQYYILHVHITSIESLYIKR